MYYVLKKNAIFAGEFESAEAAQAKALQLEGSELNWKDGDDGLLFAFGNSPRGRVEYEITVSKKKFR